MINTNITGVFTSGGAGRVVVVFVTSNPREGINMLRGFCFLLSPLPAPRVVLFNGFQF